MCVTSETDEKMMPSNDIDSPGADDANRVGTVGGSGRLKKGPWTCAEDAILVEYVTKHGEGNWNAVQKHTGLARCGKSCRLRWANHLRPDLKKGAFTPEEEHLIIELHAKMGNKWARMAAELPGRTDNEIKNYWNTRIKRQQRAGLPVYPPEICLQALNENQQKDNMDTFSSGDVHCRDVMPVNNFEIPAVQFKNLELDQHVYAHPFLDNPGGGFLRSPASGLLVHDLHSSYANKSLLSSMYPSKCFRGTESTFHGSSATMSNTIPGGSQYQSGSYVQNGQPFIYSSPYDHNLCPNHLSSSSVFNGSHAILNGNPSSSEPIWAMKQELPSFQTQTDSWGSPSSPLPSLESADTLIQTPPTEHNLSCQLSSQNSGLLDAVLHESQTLKNPRNNPDLLNSHASSMVANLMDASSQLIHEMGWDPYGELTSPLGHSSPSMFSEDTPISGNSISEPEAITGFRGKEEAAIWDQTQHSKNGETRSQMFSRPDLLLASDCFDPEKDDSSNNPMLEETLNDLSMDWKHMGKSANITRSSPCT